MRGALFLLVTVFFFIATYKREKIFYQDNNDQRGLSGFYFNALDFLTSIGYRLIIPLVTVAMIQGGV